MIAAISQNGVIGKDNDLVWNLPDDMRFFMKTTTGHPVIMGRKNYESLPEKFRPLPNRTNIVITRNENYTAEGAEVVHSIEDALKATEKSAPKECFIIGGGEIYRIGLPYANRMYLTEIEGVYDGDTFFPEYVKANWKEVSRKHHEKDDRHNVPFDFVIYERVSD